MSKQPELTKEQLKIILTLVLNQRNLISQTIQRGIINEEQGGDLLVEVLLIEQKLKNCLDEADLKEVYETLKLPVPKKI